MKKRYELRIEKEVDRLFEIEVTKEDLFKALKDAYVAGFSAAKQQTELLERVKI